jgi:penicillin-binding protein 1C
VDGVAARRQAGSTLKPFLYGLALERRYLTTASLLDDAPVNLETSTGLYIPQNYDHDFKGRVSVRTALAASLNVPAVRTLILVGVEALRDRLVDLGYAGLTESGEYYGFSLALGSAEVSLLEQVNAYRALANGGVWSPLRFLPKAGGNTPPRRVMSEEAAFLIGDVLSDDASRSVTFGLDSPLSTRYWSAVKTGTSKDMRDNWCIGYSQRYTVGVWVGNFEGDAMREVSGVSGAAPAWAAIMNGLLAREIAARPRPPARLIGTAVRFEPAIEPERDEWFIAGTETSRVLAGEEHHRAHIESPPDGVIIALDPDIPLNNQKVWFSARGVKQDRFHLDERDLGPADQSLGWLPEPGQHRLTLRRQDDGHILDSVSFQVRLPR